MASSHCGAKGALNKANSPGICRTLLEIFGSGFARAHGQSGDSPAYGLAREAEDIAAVVESRGRQVAVLGHSFGAVASYEAAFLTPKISKLLLYEPPLRVAAHSAALKQMDASIKAGDRETATTTFMREVVGVSPEELATLPNQEVIVREGQEHNAMDSDREHLASVIKSFMQTHQ